MKFRRASPQISPASVAGMSSIEDERPRKRTRTRSGRLSGWATSAAPPPPALRTTFLDFDEDCHSRILSLLAPADIARAMRACKALARAGASRTVFRALSLRLEPDPDVVNALDKEGADDDHGMGTFVKLRDDPLRRYKFISPLPTLGLNVCDNDSPGLPVYGGFSYPSLTKGQKLTNHADMADYTSFDAREVCEPRRTHRSRMWFCRDVLAFEDVAVKVLPFQESPDEGFMCRKLREVSNLKALEGGTAVTPLTKAVTVTGKLPFPRDDENDENENWENDSDEERERRKREDEAAKLLLVHPYYPVNMRAQWTRSCDAEHAASCRPPVEWIDQTDGRLLHERARSVFRQVLEGLDYAHSRGICHRNLHAGHVLLDPRANDGEGRAVIASWASSRKNQWPVGNQSPLRTCTVPYYVAPEGLLHRDADEDELEDEDGNVVDDRRGAKYGTGVDVWAAGCVFAELLLGHSLFNKFAYADGAQTLDQLLCVFKLFGTPTEETWPDAMSYPRVVPGRVSEVDARAVEHGVSEHRRVRRGSVVAAHGVGSVQEDHRATGVEAPVLHAPGFRRSRGGAGASTGTRGGRGREVRGRGPDSAPEEAPSRGVRRHVRRDEDYSRGTEGRAPAAEGRDRRRRTAGMGDARGDSGRQDAQGAVHACSLSLRRRLRRVPSGDVRHCRVRGAPPKRRRKMLRAGGGRGESLAGVCRSTGAVGRRSKARGLCAAGSLARV